MKIKKHRRYNWRPDLPDQRDFLYALKSPERKLKTLPVLVDLRADCSPVVNQGQIGSCTGNALAGAIEFLELQELKDSIDNRTQADIFAEGHFVSVSRLFVYYNERSLEGKTQEDSGATLRDGVKSLVQWGVCKEQTWKYTSANVFKKPSRAAYSQAVKHTLASYLKLENLEDMKNCLAQGFPFVFGFSVYESFESPEVARTGLVPLPRISERLLGGHAVLAVGYSDKLKALIVRNSWGTEWGDQGYFYMPYAYVQNIRLSQDFWTLRR